MSNFQQDTPEQINSTEQINPNLQSPQKFDHNENFESVKLNVKLGNYQEFDN